VSITVTTNAGSATSGGQFTYESPAGKPIPTPAPILAPAKTCTVPKLKGKSLKSSKKKIKAADCKVGKVTKKKGAKAATGKVVGQSRKPGTALPAGTVVKVTLGKG
jgi:beta-lactam-binding protein with PASTA domain